MGKSTKPQVTTTHQETVMPQYVQDAQKNLLATGQNILSPYLNAGVNGYNVAGLNPDQTTAITGVRSMYDSAMNGSGAFNPADIQKYLNPYTSNVVDTTNQTLRDQNDITLNGIRARAAAGSSFGGSGSRASLQESEANKALGNTMASTTAQLMAQGYDKATATALTSQQNDLSARQSAIQALLGVGGQQQALEQTRSDTPLRALQALTGITPQQYGSTTNGTTTAPPPQGPSALQTILGVGATAASLFSDRGAKTDIKKLGDDPETGLPMYAYRYKGDPKNTPKVVGPMAQDIEKRFPGTTKDIGGHKVVNVGALRSMLGV